VWTAVELLTPIAQRHGADLPPLLAELATGAEVDAWDPRADRITLLTCTPRRPGVPVVFLSAARTAAAAADAGRSRRLGRRDRRGAAALLRRPDPGAGRLFLSHTRRRFRHGAERDMSPTPFLSAIDPGLLERRGQDAPRKPRDRQLRLI